MAGQQFDSEYFKFEKAVRQPSGNVEQAVGYMTGTQMGDQIEDLSA